MGIERDIHELLYAHDCVIVPRFGGFLAHYRQARLDEAQELIHPPSRELSFNRHLLRNDGLLADRVARRSGLAFDAAGERIATQVGRWNEALRVTGRVELPRIGTLYSDAEGNIQFEPDRRVNYAREAYGLRTLRAMPAPARRGREEEVMVRTLVPVQDGAFLGRKRTLWAAAAVSGLLFLAAAWLVTRQDGPVTWSSLDPFGPRVAERYRPLDLRPPQLEDETPAFAIPEGNGVHALPITGDTDVLVPVRLGPDEEAPAPAPAAHVPPPVHSGRFHLIGGCFSVRENADAFLAAIRADGFDGHLVDEHKGLYRVAYASYGDRATALEALAVLRRAHADGAWLLVK